MENDLSPIYASIHDLPDVGYPILKCAKHPEWWADVDGTALPDLIRKANDHINEMHKEDSDDD